MRLNLGSGSDYRTDCWVNVDRREVKCDVVHDLNIIPYPFPDDSADEIELSQVLEHLKEPFVVMRELHRILKPGGRLTIRVPHFTRGFTHAEHEHGFDITFPYYFNNERFPEQFYGVSFEAERVELHWLSGITLTYLTRLGVSGLSIAILKVLNRFLSWLANLNPMLCSRIWAYWVGGFEDCTFVFSKPVTSKKDA